MSNKKVHLEWMKFFPGTKYDFIDCDVAVKPGHYTHVFFNARLDPTSPEFWGMVLNAGYIQFQFEMGLKLGAFTYRVYENKKNKPRKPRTAQNSEVEASL